LRLTEISLFFSICFKAFDRGYREHIRGKLTL